MSEIILDFGSGNTHKNNWDYLKKMIDELKKIDTKKHEVIIKHQLFKEAGNNIPLDREIFKKAYYYAKELEYKTTSSVFDKNSLDFLLKYDIPFIKIANNRALDWLIREIPRKIPVYVSVGKSSSGGYNMRATSTKDKYLCCVSNYPATIKEYESDCKIWGLKNAISDHTTDFRLWYRYQPAIIEFHYVLEHDPNNLDGGLFARTPRQLAEIL